MDKHNALEKLEAVRPDSDDLMDPELKDAAALVEADAELEALFHRRQNLDRKIGQVLADVEVPAGLKERLLAATVTEVADDASLGVKKVSRRTWMTMAAGLVGAAALSLWALQPSKLTLEILQAELPLTDAAITALPESSIGVNCACVRRLNGLAEHEWRFAGVYSFHANGANCVLVVVPIASADVVSLTTTGTVPFNPGYAMSGWTEGDLVCVVIVQGNAKTLGPIEDFMRNRQFS